MLFFLREMNLNLNLSNIIWSKGPLRDHYAGKQTEQGSSPQEIANMLKAVTEDNNIIFIRNGSGTRVQDLAFLADQLYLLPAPIRLITSDGDRSMPQTHYYTNTVNKILSSAMVIKWYTQNYDKSVIHPKLTHLPIGFDLHTPQWLVNNNIHDKIKFMMERRMAAPTDERIADKILSDTHNSPTHPDRHALYNVLRENSHVHFAERRVSFMEITDLYNKYNFVLSPRGNGLDCHRTWELFLAGVIVITKTSTLDDMYTKNNLPVVILKEWSELNDNLENKLKKWYAQYSAKTAIDNILPRLTFDYWLQPTF